MDKKKKSSKNDTAPSVIRVAIYGLTTALFVAASFMNEYLIGVNETALTRDGYDAYDYLLLRESEYFAYALLIVLAMIAMIDRSIIKARFSRLHIIVPAILLYSIALICMLDMTVGSWGIPGRCGEGFSRGNCFFAEGLEELIYFVAVPVCFAIGTFLLWLNKRAKQKYIHNQSKGLKERALLSMLSQQRKEKLKRVILASLPFVFFVYIFLLVPSISMGGQSSDTTASIALCLGLIGLIFCFKISKDFAGGSRALLVVGFSTCVSFLIFAFLHSAYLI